jgi:hypothetical protein
MADGSDHKSDLPEFYANGLQFVVTPFDITFTFGLQNPVTVVENVVTAPMPSVFTPTMRVRMSPQLAALVAQLLPRMIDDYEKRNGKIPISEELISQFGLKH